MKKQETKYSLAEVNVNLSLGHGGDASSEQFATQAEVQEMFRKTLESDLKDEGILASESEGRVDLIIDIDYVRTFNHGGESLNKPQVSHNVTILSGSEKLASFSQGQYTTKYGYLEDIAVNMEITAFSWDEEDEPKDIGLVSKLIVKDITNVGK
ncbi:hypothetical protein [uncultured Vibrio sp.]|uniref:hypothetical protein n=1 Tax=uncultured Vibrio sp. TaxID=114054 RepID=UPI0025E47867|nr:hypothetical protein [uncultured Vibrio sp.]